MYTARKAEICLRLELSQDAVRGIDSLQCRKRSEQIELTMCCTPAQPDIKSCLTAGRERCDSCLIPQQTGSHPGSLAAASEFSRELKPEPRRLLLLAVTDADPHRSPAILAFLAGYNGVRSKVCQQLRKIVREGACKNSMPQAAVQPKNGIRAARSWGPFYVAIKWSKWYRSRSNPK
jgi:hypothetical protein